MNKEIEKSLTTIFIMIAPALMASLEKMISAFKDSQEDA